MKTVNVEDNQTILDVAVQYYGTAEAVGEIIALNPGLKNDPVEVVNSGYEDIGSLYLDIKLLPGMAIQINEESPIMYKNVAKKISNPVTTYDNGKEY